MVFDGIDLTQYFVVEEIRRDILPPITNHTVKIPNKNGLMFKKSELGEGRIEVDIRIIKETRSKVQEETRKIAEVLNKEEPKKLKLRDEPDKYNLAILEGSTPLDKLMHTGFVTLVFTCPDPLAYGDKQTIILSSDTIFYNTGTCAATGTITVDITSNINHLEFTLQNTGEFIYIEHDFIVGDVIIIDLENEFTTKNGYSIMPDLYLESDFFDIPTGKNRITSNVEGKLEFIERWL